VLLVIFMITVPLLSQGVKVELPQAAAKPVDVKDSETLVLTVDRKGVYYLDDRKIKPAVLRKRIAAIMRLRPKTQIVVRGDRRVPYGKVVAVMALLQEAGAPSVGLITQPRFKK
jgi:biopolymer transport protein TolR